MVETTRLPNQRQEETHAFLGEWRFASAKDLAESLEVLEITTRRGLEGAGGPG